MYACSITNCVKKFSEENPSGEYKMRKLTMNIIKGKFTTTTTKNYNPYKGYFFSLENFGNYHFFVCYKKVD